ncbi:polymorphic toxin-type HINT domain-containing protein [Streptomyces sp. NPDC048664]|uniref:polymorphic toxin-type HINT domain-containing protein n=1 Tax=Streptomyces sp. NPDC048664 TaxID=3154505 RepID=UPI00343E1C58
MTATTALVAATVLAVGQVPALADQDPGGAGGGTPAAFDMAAAEQVRKDQCLLSTVLRTGGPSMKQVAAKGLDSDTAALHSAAAADYWDTTPLSTAYKTDNDATLKLMDGLSDRHKTWEAPLSGLYEPGGFKSDADFHWAPDPDFFSSVGLGHWLSQQFWTAEDTFYKEPSPLANDASAKAATDLGNARYPEPNDGNDPDFQLKYREWDAWHWKMAFMHGLFADDTRMFLENGGFPRSAPEPDTVEYRVAVEDLKSRFASCEYRNPVDPNSVLGQEVETASNEWQAEVGGVAKQRDAIFAANAKASAALATATQALGEALGQSWLADHLTRWQAYWLPGGEGAAGAGKITFQLKGNTTLCLDDRGGSKDSGAPVQAYSCNSTPSQQWWPESHDQKLDGNLYNGIGGKCLAVDTSKAVASGSKVVQTTCGSASTQHWQYVTTMGLTRLYNVGAKLCLDATATKSTQAVVKTCTGGTTQQFVAQQDNGGTTTGTDSLSYPKAAQFTQAKKALPVAQTAAKAQLTVAQQQLTIAQQAATDTTAAEQQAYAIADAAGTPRGRGLLAGQQEAQVTMASAAALKAVAGATQTAYDATTASAEDSKTLQSQAQTQASASKAAFHMAAAQEADNQAKAAAAGAALQAKNAAAQNDKAQAALKTAQQAESTAKNAADVAHAKRLAAEAQQAQAATAKNEAAAHQAQAALDRADAERYDKAANDALSAAQTAGATAADKRAAAEQSDRAASQARQKAWEAQRNRDAAKAKAEAADAYADAHQSDADAHDARAAADEADADADSATTAANQSSAAADAATQEAQAADAAATRAEAAARRAQSDADDAKAAKATADAAVRTSEAAVATAIQAASQASTDADAAKKDAAQAKVDAENAQKNAIAASADAKQSQAQAATTAGFAYTTAQAATAAADAAQKVTDSANDAIQLGSPYMDSDSSAGLAVLSAQASKTIADQQQSMAQAKADQAQKAAQSAQALADAASGDEKNAKLAAADAAVQAANAQVSAQKAVASAAQAQKAAAEAKASEARTIAYDAQATADAAAAQSAADAASSDAATARASANEAESDANAAQAAASDAQAAAATAREVAAQADKDADAAEAAAKDAEKQAESAQEAATLAEQEQAKQDEASQASTNSNVIVKYQITSYSTDPHGDCVGTETGPNAGCEISMTFHVKGIATFYALSECVMDSADSCTGELIYLDSKPFDNEETKTVHVNGRDITEAVLKGVVDGFLQDFDDCINHHKASGCAWAASWFVPEVKITEASRLLRALDASYKTGIGIEDALKALRGLELDSKAMAGIEREASAMEELYSSCTPKNSFPGTTRVLMANGSAKRIEDIRTGDSVLATDPESGRTEAHAVTRTIYTPEDTDFADITVDAGRSIRSTITATQHHPFWSPSAHRWIDAGDLVHGQTLRASDGKPVTVVQVKRYEWHHPAYNLTVDDLHTFYVVAGTTPVLVHNSGGLQFCGADAEALKSWTRATFKTVEESAVYHLGKHGKGRTFAEYTKEAMDLWNKTKASDRVPWKLADGSMGWKIRGGLFGGEGIYTLEGKIVTWHD